MAVLAAVVVALAVVPIGDDASADDGDQYTVQYVVDGSIYSVSTSTATTTVKSLSELGISLDDGVVMTAWELYTYADGEYSASGIYISAGSTVTLTTEYATRYVAVLSNAQYTVTFVVDDSVVQTSTYTANEDDSVSAPADPSKDGYVFAGWYDANGSKWSSSYSYTADTVFTASWREVYTVTYVVEGVTIATGTTESDSTLNTPSDPSKDCYEFLGWSDGTTVYSADGITTSAFTEDTVLTATFRAAVYTVTYAYVDGDDVVVWAVGTVLHGDSALDVTLPDGYVSWDYDGSAITEDTVIYAVAEGSSELSTGALICIYIVGIIVALAVVALVWRYKKRSKA